MRSRFGRLITGILGFGFGLGFGDPVASRFSLQIG
jgi:hypothetical protein